MFDSAQIAKLLEQVQDKKQELAISAIATDEQLIQSTAEVELALLHIEALLNLIAVCDYDPITVKNTITKANYTAIYQDLILPMRVKYSAQQIEQSLAQLGYDNFYDLINKYAEQDYRLVEAIAASEYNLSDILNTSLHNEDSIIYKTSNKARL